MRADLINVCQGTCCKRFYLPGDFFDKRRLDGRRRRFEDDEQIRDMVIRIRGRAHTCKHFDGERCTIYSQRPMMCRAFPYGERCRLDSDCRYSLDDYQLALAKRWLEWLVRQWTGVDLVAMILSRRSSLSTSRSRA